MSTKRKLPSKIGQPVLKQSAKILGKGALDESRTVVSSGENLIRSPISKLHDTSSILSDLDYEEDESDEASNAEGSTIGADVSMGDANITVETTSPEATEQPVEPSFGDLVKANVSEPIDVATVFDDASPRAEKYTSNAIRPPPGASLGAVLSQALRTSDIALLETCLHTSDLNIIRATIQRLESSLAGKLLQQLAERLHKRPGRAGNLMVWVQWTLVAHGGYLATQRGLVQSLAELKKVIDERSKGLQCVLSLKGKLDLLEAQIELRRSIRDHQRRDNEDDDDSSVIYVEDQEFEDKKFGSISNHSIIENLEVATNENSEMSDESSPIANGVNADSEDEEYSSDDDNLIDDEALEVDSDLTDEEDVDSEDSVEDEEESDVAPRPKLAKVHKDYSKK